MVYPFALLLLGLSIVGSGSCARHTLTVEEIDSAIKRDIPPGSSVTAVSSFLDSRTFGQHRFTRSAYLSDHETISMLLEYSTDDKARKLKGTLKGVIDAAIPHVEGRALNTSEIVARFYFDDSDRLLDYTVKETVGK